VANVGSDLLVVLESCSRERASAIAQALAESNRPLAKKDLLGAGAPIPFHPGALEAYAAARHVR
jgi:hypothetical protein